MADLSSLVSVILPVHNGARYLREAISSVLAQGPFDLEVVVVDDGSTDDSAEVASTFGPPVRCVSQPQGGVAAARNTGLERARGSFVAFVDADDFWPSNKLKTQLAALTNDPALEAVFGHVQQFLEEPDTGVRQLGPVQAGHTPSTMLIRMEALRRVGLFNVAVPLAESVDWYARAVDANLRYTVLPDIVLHRRIHGQNTGIQKREDQERTYLQVLRAVLQQRRAKSSD